MYYSNLHLMYRFLHPLPLHLRLPLFLFLLQFLGCLLFNQNSLSSSGGVSPWSKTSRTCKVGVSLQLYSLMKLEFNVKN